MDQLVPHSDEAEWSVVGQMLAKPNAIPEVIGQQLELDDFYRPDCRLIFERAVENHYAGELVDAVTIGDRLAVSLASQWGCQPNEVSQRLYAQAASRAHMTTVVDHARLIKRHALNRRLISLTEAVKQRISLGDESPEEIGNFLTTEASRITTGTLRRSEIIPYIEVGREYVKYLQRLKLAREQGIELAVYTGFKFWDQWTLGIAPGELMMVAGPPGVGKSALTFGASKGFAKRQKRKVADKRVATLVMSLEMSLQGSASRLATEMTGIEGDKLREGIVDDDDLAKIAREWRNDEDLPLYFNFASNFRMSQMRALTVEAIRRHNVGLVVVDHFRMFDPDRRINNLNQEDEAKARFLKEDIAKDLNVAVLCLAHTTKLRREESDGRPQLGDLRGSGQVAAHCDIVAFMHMPWMFATDNEKSEGVVSPTDAELIFRKNRSGALGTSPFVFEPSRMDIHDPIL